MSFYVYSKVFIIYIIVWHYSVIFILFSLKKPWKIENGAKLFQTYDGICWNFCEQQQQKCARHKITYHDGMGKLMEFHPLLKFLPSSSILSTKKILYQKIASGVIFFFGVLRVLIIGPRRSTREFSTIICWYYSRYSLVHYRFLVRFHWFFRGCDSSFDIGPHLFTCLRIWTIFDGACWPVQSFRSNIFNLKWKVRKCWNHGNNLFVFNIKKICMNIFSLSF